MKFSKIALSLALGFAAQAASAGVISIVIDDFSVAASGAANNNRSGSFTSGFGDAAIVSDAAYVTSPIFSISVGALPTTGATYTLNYSGIALPTAATPGSVSFVTLWNNNAGSNGSGTNTVSVNGAASTGLSTGDVVYAAYAGGALSMAFNTPPTRSWDILIDNIKVSFNCASAATANYASLDAYAAAAPQSCATVPVPGSLALLGLGGIAAGLVARRRTAK